MLNYMYFHLGHLVSVKVQCKLSFFFLFAVAKINMSHVKLIFWDLGGQQELQSLWDKVLVCSKSCFANYQ